MQINGVSDSDTTYYTVRGRGGYRHGHTENVITVHDAQHKLRYDADTRIYTNIWNATQSRRNDSLK